MITSIERTILSRRHSPTALVQLPGSIFVTGFTEKICGIGNARIDFWDCNSIPPMLRRHGWTVQHRPFAVGERLTDVGAVIVVIGASPTADHALHAFGAMWSMVEAIEHGLPLVVIFEDWNLADIGDGFRVLAEQDAGIIASQINASSDQVDAAAALSYADRLQDLARQFGNPSSPLWQMAVPAFLKFREWGESRRLLQRFIDLPVWGEIDPTPLFLSTLDIDKAMPEKERKWALAALTRDAHGSTNGQEFSWQIDHFGRLKDGQPELPDEQAVFNAYTERWGVINPRYYHAGSGWYRSRYVQAVAAGAVLLCDPEDAAPLGPAFQITATQVEGLSEGGLRELAAAQRAALWPRLSKDEQETLQQLEDVLDLAAERAGSISQKDRT